MWTLLSLVLWWKWNVIGPFNLTSTMLILKVNPKCANSGHFKLTIDGLLRAINQTMEVGWGDWRLCSGTAGRGWSLISSLSQGLVFECYPNMDQGWPVASVWQAASPHRPDSKHRMRIILAAGIVLAHLSLKYKECMEDLCRHNISLTEGCAMILVSSLKCQMWLRDVAACHTERRTIMLVVPWDQSNQSIQITIAKYKPLNPWCCMELVKLKLNELLLFKFDGGKSRTSGRNI